MLVEAGRHGDVVLGVPGADIFKEDWVKHFKGRRVFVCYDNDEAGDRGAAKVGRLLTGVAKSLKYLCWPDGCADGYDIRDWYIGCKADRVGPLRAFSRLNSMFREEPRRGPVEAEAAPTQFIVEENRPTLNEIVKTFSKWVLMDKEMIQTLKVVLTVAFSQQLEGDPLWMLVVGVPGCGKSLTLCSLQKSDRCLFRSTLTPHSLVSGFQHKDGHDPSLLSIVHRMIVIFKDWTELIELPVFSRKEIGSIFRGAYDGSVSKSFGNGVHREYSPLHFTVIAGVTPDIHKYADATLGDRMLKYESRVRSKKSEVLRIRAAIASADTQKEMEEDVQETVRCFLSCDAVFPRVPAWVVNRLTPLVQLIARLRAQIAYLDGTRDEVACRPAPEIGTRIAKQAVKFIRSSAAVHGRSKITEEDYALTERVLLDTSSSLHVDIVKCLLEAGRPLTRREIADAIDMPVSSLGRRLETLQAMKLVVRADYQRKKGSGADPLVGKPPSDYQPSEDLKTLWKESHA
jgi:hypothetical protein